MKNAITCADCRLAIVEGVPDYSHARLKVVPVIAVERRQALFFLPGDPKGEWRGPAGIGKKSGKQVVHFVRNAVELITETVVQSQIRKNFERVLHKGRKIFLAKASQIIRRAVAVLVEELRLRY